MNKCISKMHTADRAVVCPVAWGSLILQFYKLWTFVSVALALGSVALYVEVDAPPWIKFLAST
jgi:hypothetical protein